MSSRPEGSALMEKLVSLCKRRGFVYPASEIYGGLNGFWDYGPLGAQLKTTSVTDGGGTWWSVRPSDPTERRSTL